MCVRRAARSRCEAEEGRVMTGSEAGKRFAIDGTAPQEVVFATSVEQVSETLRSAGERKLAVAPVGLGAFLHLGARPRRYDVALCLERLNKLVDYQPTDMTVTVEAGMRVSQLQAVLGENGQWLPLDPPNPERVTVGGLIATNLSGPARLSQGTVRDFLIGLRIVRPDGSVVKGGGRVVKNVAGYDLAKLYCGSLGTLGVIVEATFKIRPRPEAQAILILRFPSAEHAMRVALQQITAELQPLFLELTNFDPAHPADKVDDDDHLSKKRSSSTLAPAGFRLVVGLAGVAQEVDYQRQRLTELANQAGLSLEHLEGQAAHNLALALRDFQISGPAGKVDDADDDHLSKQRSSSTLLRCKTSLLPDQVAEFCSQVEEETGLRGLAVQFQARAGNGIVYSRFVRPDAVPPDKVDDDKADDDDHLSKQRSSSTLQLVSLLDWLRILVKKMNGYLVVEQIDPSVKDRIDVWGPSGGAFPLMKKLKETFDPQQVLNPGRFVGGI